MTKVTKILLTLIILSTICATGFFVGNVSEKLPEAEALTVDEAKLCILLNTPIGSEDLDVPGFIECIATLNN